MKKRIIVLAGGEERVIDAPTSAPHGRQWYAMSAKDGVAEVHIYDFIDAYGVNGRTFLKDLKALGDVKEINLRINSPGGDVFEGNTIYNLLKTHKAKVTVTVDGLAASIASVIAMAGDTIVMPKNAMMMIHDPWSFSVGNATDMRKMADVLDKITTTLVAAYQSKTGLNEAEIKTIMNDETWFTAEEAVAMGFADEVAKEVKVAACADPERFKAAFTNCPSEFLAAIAGGPANDEPGTSRPSAGEHIEDIQMLISKPQILALAAAIGLAQSTELTAVADKLVADKADIDKVTAELTKLKPADSKVDVTAAVTAALNAERQRATDIRGAAKKLKMDGVQEFDALVTQLIDDGVSIEAAREKLFNARAEKEEKDGPIISFSGNTQTFDNPQFRREALATAFASRFSNHVKLTDQAKPYAQHSVMDIMDDMLRAQGHRNPPKDRHAKVVLALHSTSDFPYLLGDVANKILLPAYAAANPAYRAIAAKKTFNDFKAHKFLRVGDFPNLLQVGEGGEIKQGTLSESKETVTMYTYARILGVTRQMLINDDLSAFADMAGMIGRRVPQFENTTVMTLLTSNSNLGPAMADTYNLFDSTNHGNYTSSGTAVNVVKEVGLMAAKMMKQTSLDGLKLNLNPSILLVGPDSVTMADQVTTQITPTETAKVNRIGPTLTRVADANISGYGWYLFADPMDAPALIWGSLAGQEGPMVSTKQGWDVSGVEIKVERDFGCGAIDYRPVTFNAGAASA